MTELAKGKPVIDGYQQVTPGGGEKLDTSEVVVAGVTVERERATITNPLDDEESAGFTLDYGLLARGIYNKKIVSAFWLLVNEVHALRIAMENEDSSI